MIIITCMCVIQIMASCNVVLSLGVSEPLMKLITGLELVLRKAQVLNMTIVCMYSVLCMYNVLCTCFCMCCNLRNFHPQK